MASLVRSIFAQPSADEVWAQHGRVVEQVEGRFPQAAELLAQAADDILVFTAFPSQPSLHRQAGGAVLDLTGRGLEVS